MARRTTLCLGCRTVLAAGEGCDHCDDAEVVDLTSRRGRASARAAAWHTETRQEVRPWLPPLLGAVIGVGGLVGIIVITVLSVKKHWGLFPAEIIVGTVLWVASWALIAWLPERFKRTMSTRTARGPAKDVKPPPITSYSGTVGGDQEVAAEAFEARHGDVVSFRDAHSHGFELLTESTPIAIPEGRVRALLGAAACEDITPDWPEYGMSRNVAEDIAPHDGARRWLLRAGDEVRIFATLEDVLDGDATYRQNAPPTRRAVGVVWIEPVGGGD